MTGWVYGICLVLLCLSLTSCESCGDDGIPPAEETTPRTTLYLQFGNSFLFDTVTDRYDSCRYFDGLNGRAVQMVVEIMVPGPGGLKNLYPPQVFKRYNDFPSGDPSGKGVQVPETGGYVMVVTIIGEESADCCPGPPPGRPVYRTVWPYGETQLQFRVRKMLPETVDYCLYF
jgi:hypothetical protein